jgi:Domain of unknown function DUF222.
MRSVTVEQPSERSGAHAVLGMRPGVSREFAALDNIVEGLEHVERQLAALQACRVDLLAAAEEWASGAAEAGIVYGSSHSQRLEYAHRTIVAEIAAALRESERTTNRKLSQAHGVARLRDTRKALHEGRIGLAHASVIAEACGSVPNEARAELEGILLPIALQKTPAILARKARAARERLHPEPIEERHRAARLERHVSYEADQDGMAWLHKYGPAPEIVREYETLTALGTRMQGPDEPRTLGQLRADILDDLILQGTIDEKLQRIDPGEAAVFAGGEGLGPNGKRRRNATRARRSARPRVLVIVPALTLLGESEEPAILDGYGPIDAQTARELAAEAPSFQRLLTHPVTGAVLALDRTTYRVPADLRRWVQARDGTCRAPGCNRSSTRTDLDHTLAWQDDGLTQDKNLASLCRPDHVKKHRLGWRVTQDDRAHLTWVSPTGRHYVTEPELAVGAPPTTSEPARPDRPRASLVGSVVNADTPPPF